MMFSQILFLKRQSDKKKINASSLRRFLNSGEKLTCIFKNYFPYSKPLFSSGLLILKWLQPSYTYPSDDGFYEETNPIPNYKGT